MSRLRKLQIALWALAALAAAAAFLVAPRAPQTATAPSGVQSGFKAEFQLTDHTGTPRSEEDYAGKWLLVFFGFTNCPDICPTGLSTISEVMDALGPKAAKLQPLFITADPERDTPQQLAEYLEYFHPAVTGLTGTPAEIDRTAKTFRSFVSRSADPDAPDGYSVSHSSSILLYGPDGRYLRLFDYDAGSDRLLSDLKTRL